MISPECSKYLGRSEACSDGRLREIGSLSEVKRSNQKPAGETEQKKQDSRATSCSSALVVEGFRRPKSERDVARALPS